jgi:hypothetical protein
MNKLTELIRKNPSAWFYGAWLLINLVQSYGTELLHDEAYYWVYSRYPAWGYFDHPPMVALLIKIGYSIFPNELGVRLLIALMNTATLWLVHQLLVRKDDGLFFAITASMGVLQIGGILAVPDLPLTFFTALFFWQYRRFLKEDNVLQALLLGIVMAGMLYSKYHGILIILFTVASNWRLALNPRAWLAVAAGVLLFFPHLYWQYQADFPSASYHLKERNAPAYQIGFTLEYLGGQILLAGPLIGFLLLWGAYKYRPAELFTRALQWSMWGFYAFFLLSTLKGRVEANWTVPALVPLIILSHAWLADQIKPRRWIFKLLVPSLVLVLIVRAYMILDIPSLNKKFKDEMHGNRNWAQAIQQHSQGLPVVFLNSYQRPSKYWFYSGDTSFAINTTRYRRNNYNFWPIEREWQGRTVLVADAAMESAPGSISFETDRGTVNTATAENLRSFSHIRLLNTGGKLQFSKAAPVEMNIEVEESSLQDFGQLLAANDFTEPWLLAEIFKGKESVQRIGLDASETEPGKYQLKGREILKLEPGNYVMKLGILTSLPGQYSQNSIAIPLTISE